MACKEEDAVDALRNITQCSICIETFNDPRALPCAHAFCLKCLEKTQSKTKAQCALCRKPFDIPVGGLSELPKNTMIQELLDLSRKLKPSDNSVNIEQRQKTVERTVKSEASLENSGSPGAKLPTHSLDCGNCNECEHCSRAKDANNYDAVHKTAALDVQMKERSIETTEIPNPEEIDSLCDVCVLNNLDGNQKVSTATLHCLDCNENQCEKCGVHHKRQRLSKNHAVVSLEDHLKEKLLQKEEPEETVDTTIFCDVCIENTESGTPVILTATLRCVDCSENQCDDCSREHKRQRLSKDHQIVELDDQLRDSLRKMKETNSSNKDINEDILCDICTENSENGAANTAATLHCVDCDENQCDDCNREHKRQRLSKDHQIVVLDDQLKDKLIKMKEIARSTEEIFCDVCAENSEKGNVKIAAIWHCTDCSENQCDDCSREHKRQRLSKDHQVVVLDDHLKDKLRKMKEIDRSNNEDIFCDVCAGNGENGIAKTAATLHCMDCTENQCDDCSRQHKRQRLSKDHRLVVLDDQLKDKLIKMKELASSAIKNMFCNVCAENSENRDSKIIATWHCIDCHENQCNDCIRQHKRQSLSKSHQCVLLDDQMTKEVLKSKDMTKSDELYLLCDVCAENNDQGQQNVVATHHCTECNENQCENCSKEHKRHSISKSHQIVALDTHMIEKLLKVKENTKKPDLEIVCDICAENSELRETGSAATLHCIVCDENHCNNCSKEHKKQSLFRNHEIVPMDDQMKRNISEMKAEAEIICDMCTANEAYQTATLYCIDCKENQCEECNRSHVRQKLFREHQVVALNVKVQQKEKPRRTCVVHSREQLQVYCFTCQQVICMKCIDKEHNSHNCQCACTAAEGFLNDIDGYLENIDSLLQQADVTKHELGKKILETAKVNKASRKNYHSYVSEDLRSPKEHELNTKVEMKKELDKHVVNLSELKKQCNGLKTHKSSIHICLAMNELRLKFEEVRRQQMLCSLERLLPRSASSFEGYKSSDPDSPYYGFRQQMKEVMKTELTYMLKDEAYSKIRKMIERPQIKEDEINLFWRLAFPYVIQRVKLWNGYVLTAQNIADLVIRKRKEKEVTADPQSSTSCRKTLQKLKTSEDSVNPVSRLDCLTYLINIADCIVAHDILRIMSKFPMAIPLVVQDIHDDDKYIVTVPIIQNTVIKWESTPGQIAENHLFTSPFRMVAAIRLGTNKIGKSTILNQMMSKQFLFSSKGEAGSRYGRPCTLDGAVEIVWLTQDTCSSPTWKTMSEFYKRNTEEVAILANLHGGAMQHQETLKYFRKYGCSFIVFLMPDFSEEEWDQLKQCIKSKHIIQVLVDPQENVDDECYINTIRTESLSSDDTLDTMRCLLKDSLSFRTMEASANIEEICHPHEPLRLAESLHCKNSAEIVAIVRGHGCFNIKQLLSSADIKTHAKWDYTLKRLMTLFFDIISLPTQDAKKYLTHLETNLSQISANESIAARAEVREANEKLRRIIRAPKKTTNGGNSEDRQIEADLQKIQQELKAAMDKVENMNLGQEHFFRTVGQMYENSLGVTHLGDFTAVRDLPNHFADLLINGHAIEMLNGDSGKIQLIWIKAICDSVLKKLPNLKVFVISIIGLQSSGKSTLLNALFSCRFAVSVGRCSRGLFMRMIFLDKKLRKSLGYNAVILIDTEGLSSPEKMNDLKANQKDRLMATFAMGVSNLTMVNILGEGMTEMTEILQIAIVAMARLRGGGIKPDILMVQHLQERNVSKMDQAKGQFCEAINKAFELISKNDVEIGSASAECLAELTARIHSGDLFQHFGPFKDGSSVNSPPSESYHDDVVSLLETILKRTEVSESKSSFERWCNHFESYWACVQEESFALNFKNVKHITDFLYFEKKIAKVKELLDRAIRCHREMFSKSIREQVSSQIAEKRSAEADSMHRQRLLEEIEQQMQLIPPACPANCEACRQFSDSHVALLEEISNSEWKEDTKRSLEKYNARLHEITMKMLRQTFDGSLVRQGCFSEFSDRIAAELKEALLKRPCGIYTIQEQKEITQNIWEYLQAIAATMEAGPDLEEKLNQTLHREYSAVLPSVLKDFKNEITFEHLANSSAICSFWTKIKIINNKLSEDQTKNLISAINQMVEAAFGSRCVNFNKTGLDFEEGMVSDIKAAFPDVIKAFETRFHMKLYDTFKINIQMYALQQFRKKMAHLQKLWDSQNKPTEILKLKKQDYITEIETRLKSGFSSAGEGEVVATKLCNAVKKKAIQAGYDEKVQSIKDMSWTTNSEKVRLCYFEEMASEVAAGKKDRALQYFQNPKDEIEKWYKQRVDSFDAMERVMKMYESTLKTELNRLLQKIVNSTAEADISRIVEEHIKAADDRYYSKLDPKDYDFDAFKSSIERKLQSFYELDDRENIVFPLTSDDSEIMGRLGCTEHCFWCGALCWGSRDHQLEKDKLPEMETHHSCHQPSGLVGVRGRFTNKLHSTACHNRLDNTRVHFREYQDDKGMPWSEAKRVHFREWKFDVHCTNTFDELMRWFFQELHQDIAKSKEVLPADEKDLEENKCKNLKLCDILNVVRNKI